MRKNNDPLRKRARLFVGAFPKFERLQYKIYENIFHNISILYKNNNDS